MAAENCMLDIHICGACRSEFIDIYKFIQHKKECYLSVTRGQGQVPELSHLTGQCIQQLHTSDGLELQLQNTEFHNDAYQYSATHTEDSTDIPHVSSQISLTSILTTGSEHSMPDCVRKDSSQCSYVLNSAMVSEHKNLDVTAPYSYSWSAEPDIQDESVSTTMEHNVAENDLTLVTDTVLHRKSSMKDENTEEFRNQEDISTENIAVYVMSPKSFASSVSTRSKFDHDSRSKPTSDFSTGSLWNDSQSDPDQQNHILDALASVISSPIVNSKRPYISFDGAEQHNDLIFIHQDNTESGMQKPVINSGLYNHSELTLGSNNSTPCPEDLEVGQISAAMFGKKNQQEDLKIILNASTTQAIPTVSESLRDSCKTSFHNSTSILSQAESYYKMLVNEVKSVHGYIRENTASAPIIKTKKGLDGQSKRRVSVEKRERLQGVSDELLSSPVKYIQASSARSQALESSHKPETQVTNGNITNTQLSHTSAEMSSVTAPSLTSYKAVFTSPSSGGNRLTPTQAEPSHCSIQGFLSLKRQLFTKGSGGFVSKSVEYKNISASVQNQGRQSEAHLPHPASGCLTAGKKNERENVNFEKNINPLTRCPEQYGLTMNQDLTLSTVQGHSINVAQAIMKTSDNFHNHQSSVLAPFLNNPLISSSKAQTSLTINEMQENQLNTDYNVELSVINDDIHLEDDATVPVMSNLRAVQTYIGEISSSDSNVTTSSAAKPDHTLIAQKDDSQDVLSSYANSSSIVMIYKNNEGSLIMLPKLLYTKAVQNSSQATEVSGAKMVDLSLENEHKNLEQNHNQQLVNLDVIHTHDSSSSISQHYYIQNLGSSFLNQPQVASGVDGNTAITSSDGSYILNQAINAVPNSTHQKTPISKEVITQKPPVSSPKLNRPAALEKEKYIIKPRKAEGLSKSSAAALEQLNKDVKKTLQISPVKELQMSDVTEWEEDKKTRSFTCKFDKCRYTTTLYKDFQRHYRRHTGEKPYQCVDCGKTFNRSDKLKIHQRRHSGLKPFQCQICDYAAIEGGSLKKHMRIHTDERPFKCQICSYASRNSSQLIVHLRTHTGDSPFHCTKCSAKFKINSDLKRHMRIHTGEKPFQCDKCDYKSSNKGNLKTHMKINHLEENEIPCPVCEFVTSSKKRLREHEKTHNVQVIKCVQCDYTCANLGQLRSHTIIHNSLKPYRCNFCSYSSKQSGNLKKHVQNMHLYKMQARSKNSAADLEDEIKLQGTRRENVLLPIAEKLNIHRRRGTAGCRKLHTCGQCGSSFVREDSLRCHMKQHNSTIEENTLGKESKEQFQLQKMNTDSQDCSVANNAVSACYGHQGIQQIVAAASKIYEENYGTENSTSNSPTSNMNLFASKRVPDVNIDHSVKSNQSQTSPGAATVNEIKCKKAALLHVPWEHRSYTLSVSSDNEGSHPSANSQAVPLPSVSQTKIQTHILKTKNPQNKCSKIHHKLQPSKDSSFRPSAKRQAAKGCSPQVMKNQKVEKPFSSYPSAKSYQIVDKPIQLTNLHQHGSDQSDFAHQTLVPSDSTSELSEEPGAESTVLFTQQGAEGSTVDSFYNIELVPQFEASQGTLEHHQLSLGAMHIQLQPTTHIQIVMPGATVPKYAQLISGQNNPVISQPQILLQVQESSEAPQIFTIPAGSLNMLQTTDQVIPHMLSHCTFQQSSQVKAEKCSTKECQSSDPASTHLLGHPTNQLGEIVQNIVTSSDGIIPELVQDAMIGVEDPQVTFSAQENKV